MKNRGRFLVLFWLLIATPFFSTYAGVTFGSRDSAIKIDGGARLNIGSSNLIVDGTIQGAAGADFTGQPINFNGGLFSSAGLEAVMTGFFDPTGSDYIKLQGNGQFRAEPGTILQGLQVESTGNRLEGQPLFSYPISLTDAATQLTLALQCALNQDIELNSGLISLDDNLSLNDNVQIVGPGNVLVNQRQLVLGSVYTSPWATSLAFDDAAEIVLNGKVSLTGTWTFGGTSCLTGNGILDLSSGGQLIVDNNATLIVDGIHIIGLGNAAGKIIMRNAASTVRASGSTFEFVDSFSVDQGVFYVEGGPSTFLNADWNIVFGGTSVLRVDGTTLWLDYLDMPAQPGLVSGNMDFINHGTVKSQVDRSTAGRDAATERLIHTIITSLITLDQNVALGPNEGITTAGPNAVIDGSGMTILFSEQTKPQFTVRPGGTVTLQNIVFEDINQNTFDLRDNSTILIGDNVTWYLDEDITFSRGNIRVLDGATGSNVFTLRGETTRRKFKIDPVVPVRADGVTRKIFDLGHNTVQLESVELSGFGFMSFASSGGIDPATALSRNAGADINIDTAMNLMVEGIDNDLILRHDQLTLSGAVFFGDLPDNRVRVRFSLTDPAVGLARNGILAGYPAVIFTGAPGIYLTSELGLAQLDFIDTRAAIRLSNSNAFIAEANSLLTYNHLQVLDNPISQMSRYFRADGTELIGSIDASGVRFPTRAHSFKLPVCALQVRRKMDREAHARAQQEALEALKHKPYVKPIVKPTATSSKPKIRGVDDSDFDEGLEISRALNLPVQFDTQPVNQLMPLTAPLNGNIRYERCTVTNVTVNANTAFNILLDSGTVLTLGADVSLNNKHVINVRGLGNVINVTGNMTIGSGNLFFDEGAELTINFINSSSSTPSFVVSDDVTLNIEKRAILRIQGNGVATFGANDVINLNGEKTTTGSVLSRSQLIVQGNAVLTTKQATTTISQIVDPYPHVYIRGVGTFEVSSGGIVQIDLAKLVFGIDTDTVGGIGGGVLAENANDVQFLIHDDGLVDIEEHSWIEFRYGQSDIRFERGGQLFINGGILMLNATTGAVGTLWAATPGKITNLAFDANGKLYIKNAGILVVGPNRFNTLTARPITFNYQGNSGVYVGDGFVQYLPVVAYQSKGFIGRLHPTTQVDDTLDLTSEQFVEMMVQQLSTLTVSTLYINPAGNQVIRTKKGVSVTLQSGDTILSDNATTGAIAGRDAQGKNFTITADGTRS